MNFIESFLLYETQAVCLIPTIREHIERYLPAYGISQTIVCELLTQDIDKGNSDAVSLRVLRVSWAVLDMDPTLSYSSYS